MQSREPQEELDLTRAGPPSSTERVAGDMLTLDEVLHNTRAREIATRCGLPAKLPLDPSAADIDHSALATPGEDDFGLGQTIAEEYRTVREEIFLEKAFSPVKRTWNSVPTAFVAYVYDTLVLGLSQTLFNPLAFLSDPISFTWELISYGVLFNVLLIVELALGLFQVLGFARLVRYVSETYADGWGLANWWGFEMFDQAPEIVRYAEKGLLNASGNPHGTPEDEKKRLADGGVRVRFFNLDIAKAFLFFSALVYERNDALVEEAAQLEKRPDSHTPVVTEKIQFLLEESERFIRAKANSWGVQFRGVSDLTQIDAGGSYCGLFWNKESKWITLVFKGTSPTNKAEFLIDSSIARIPASAYLFGEVHKGFFTSIWPNAAAGGERRVNPYASIVQAVKAVAKELRADGDEKVHLWLAGHSLGAALGSLIYSRFLKSPEDIGDDIELSGTYFFGAPRVGDGDFAGAVQGVLNVPWDRAETLWRIRNGKDIVAVIPPGLADQQRAATSLNKSSSLNYAHVGSGLHIVEGEDAKLSASGFPLGAVTRIVQAPRKGKKSATAPTELAVDGPVAVKQKGWNPIPLIAFFIPSFLFDHFPARYGAALEQVKPGDVIESD